METSAVRTLLGDFRAFYCGGSLVLHGADPYASGPLLRCEQTPAPFGLHSAREADLPAPFPGYALAAFAVFSLLPYPVAAAAWFLLLLVCTTLACIFLGRLCDRPAFAAFAFIAVAFSVAVIPYGELAPIILAALTGGALALRRGVNTASVLALGVLALLPHVALPVFLALFIWNKAMRWPIVVIGIVLACLDVAVGGPNLALAYFLRVLPNHAASEIGFVTQYSVTWLAQGIGAPDRLALIAGNASYAAMVVAGIWFGGLVSKRFRDPAFLMLIPAACAVTGGSFIHYSEITLALPAALLLYVRSTGVPKVLAAVAAVLVALPWQAVVTQPALMIPIAAGAITIAAVVLQLSPRYSLRIGAGATLFCALCILAAWHFGPQTAPHTAGRPFDPTLAEASWAKLISDQTSSSGIVWWIPKLPTWSGLLALFASGVMAAAGRE